MENIERRIAPRYATSVPVGIRFPVGPVHDGWGRIINISASGLRLETYFPMKAAGVIYVSFALQDGARFDNLRSRVIRISYEDGYYVAGIAFDEVVDQETLKDVITSLASTGGLRPLT